jgi:putative oxidoreductase
MAQKTIGLPDRLSLRIVSILLTIAFLMTGGMKLASNPQLVASFQTYGYPAGSHFVVGLFEITGAIGLFVRPFARYAASILVVISIGAVSTHIVFPPLQQGIPALVLLILSAYPAYQYNFVSNGADAK